MAATRKRRSTSKGKGKPVPPIRVFAHALDARMKPLCAELGVDPVPLVSFLARAAEADVKALVPAQYQDAVLSSPTLAERWPLTSGNISALKGQPERASLAPLIRRHIGAMAWPTTVSNDEVAGLLDNLNPSATEAQRRTALCMARLVREPHRMMPVVSAIDGEPASYWADPRRRFTAETLDSFRDSRSPFRDSRSPVTLANLFVYRREPGFAVVYYIDDLTPQQLGVPEDELATYEGILRAFTDERFSLDDFRAVAAETDRESLSSARMLIPLLSLLGTLFLPTENEAEDDGGAVTPEKTLARLRDTLRGDTPRATLQEIRDELTRRVVLTQAIATWDSFAVAWIAATLKEVREAEPGLRVSVVHDPQGDEWARLPKATAAMSWAFGAPGVEIDGDSYAAAPNATSHVATYHRRLLAPRSFALIADGNAQPPHQAWLPLELGEEETALPVAVVDSTHYALEPISAKLGVLLLATASAEQGRIARVTLGELTRKVNPFDRRIQKRDLELVARGLDQLRGLFLYLPDATRVQVFDVQSPATPDDAAADMALLLGVTRTFLQTCVRPDRSYRGEFVLNLSGAMRLPNKRPQLLRFYVRSAAHWNAAFNPTSSAFDPNRLKPRTVEGWAILANTLSPSVVEYLREHKPRSLEKRRFQLAKEKHNANEALDELEGLGLVVREKVGRHGEIKLLPPAPYREAWAEMHRSGPRPIPVGDDPKPKR